MRIGCLGAGRWGLALCALLGKRGHRVCCWSDNRSLVEQLMLQGKHPLLPHFRRRRNVTFTTDLLLVVRDAELLIEALSPYQMRMVFQRLAERRLFMPILLTSQGMEEESGLFLPQVLKQVLGPFVQIAYLGGEKCPEEILIGKPAKLLCASVSTKVCKRVLRALYPLHVDSSDDLLGACLGGALKQVLSVACGVVDALCLDQQIKATLLAHTCKIFKELIDALDCQEETLFSTTGIGEFWSACLDQRGDNYRYGNMLGWQITHEQIESLMNPLVEGRCTAFALARMGEELKIDLPLVHFVTRLVEKRRAPRDILGDFLNA